MPGKTSQSMSIADLSKKISQAVQTVSKKHPEVLGPDAKISFFPNTGTLGFVLDEANLRRLAKDTPKVVAAEFLAATKLDGTAVAKKPPAGGTTIIIGFQMNFDNLYLLFF